MPNLLGAGHLKAALLKLWTPTLRLVASICNGLLTWSGTLLIKWLNIMMNVQDKLQENFFLETPMELDMTNTIMLTQPTLDTARLFPAESVLYERCCEFVSRPIFVQIANGNLFVSKTLFKNLCMHAVVTIHTERTSTISYADAHEMGVWLKDIHKAARLLSFGARLLVYNDSTYVFDARLPVIYIMENNGSLFFYSAAEFLAHCNEVRYTL